MEGRARCSLLHLTKDDDRATSVSPQRGNQASQARREEDVGEGEAHSRSGAREKPLESLLEGPNHFGIVIDIGAGVIGAGFGNLRPRRFWRPG